MKRTLKPGEIDRFSDEEPIDIDYQVISFQLLPGGKGFA